MYNIIFLFFLFLSLKAFGSYPWRNSNEWHEKSAPFTDSLDKNFSLLWKAEGRKDQLAFDLQSFYIFKRSLLAVFPGVTLIYKRPAIHIDLGYQYDLFAKDHYYRISELALYFPLPIKTFLLSVGFKKHIWSQADRYWNYGFWQPRYILDPLRPKQMGLPGIYLKYEGESSLLFYVSPLTFPNFVARPRLIEGKPFSENPFFLGAFMAEKSKFHWSLDKIKPFHISDFLKPSAGLQIKHKLPYSTLSISYAYKPANQLHYAVRVTAENPPSHPTPPPSSDFKQTAPKQPDTKKPSSEKLDLSELSGVPAFSLTSSEEEPANKPAFNLFHITDLTYSLNYHHLITLEAEMHPAHDLSIIGSITYENPETPPSRGASWISDNRESNLMASVLLQMEENVSPQSEVFFTLAYSNIFEIGRRTANSNIWIEAYEAYFTGGIDWKNAVAVSLEYRTTSFFKENHLNIRLNYDLDNKLYLLNIENKLFLSSDFRVYWGGDLFLTLSESQVNFPSSYIAQYKDLSRMIVGAEYVF